MGAQEGDFSELLVAGVKAKDDTAPSRLSRLQKLIHMASQYPLLPVIEQGAAVHISLLPQGTSVEALVCAKAQRVVSEFRSYAAWRSSGVGPALFMPLRSCKMRTQEARLCGWGWIWLRLCRRT